MEIYHRATPVEKVFVEDCGNLYRSILYTVSEDGRQDEFEVEEWTPEEVEAVREIWVKNPKLVYQLTAIRPLFDDHPESE